MEILYLAIVIGVLGLLVMVAILVLSREKDGVTSAAERPADVPPSALTIEALGEQFGRMAFLPDVEPGDHGKSHFAGRPWLKEGESWPVCSHCGGHLQLLLQLDLDTLPNGSPPQRSGGFAQVFDCTSAETCRDLQARIVDPTLGGAQAPEDLAPNPLPCGSITAWEGITDLPSLEEVGQLGGILTDEVEAYLVNGDSPQAGDKLGGWPGRIHAPGVAACPRCEGPMELVFQLANDDHVAPRFEGGGPRHLMRCPRHPTALRVVPESLPRTCNE